MTRSCGSARGAKRPPVACLVSLGCSKNTVDSERLLALLVRDGWLLSERPDDADVCLVNTCGFIADARAESSQTLADLARGRIQGRPRRIVALGCMVERAGTAPETAGALAAADARIGFGEYDRLPAICRELLSKTKAGEPGATGLHPGLPPDFHDLPRLLTGSPHSASLKIGEGCSNRCSFCSIPLIRGPQVSRSANAIVHEARDLVAGGVKEICLIAQDTTAYGRDLHDGTNLAGLFRRLSEALDPALWIRLMYTHPRRLSDPLIRVMRDLPQVCPYLDLPLQHVADSMLRAMNRGMTRDGTRRRLDRIREIWPEAVLRTTFILGFPGETESDFLELLEFVREGHFLHIGAFVYSPEPGTRAERMPGTVDPVEAERRRDTLLQTQRGLSRLRLREWIGRTVKILLDAPRKSGPRSGDGTEWTARTRWQAPEVDGRILLRNAPPGLSPGEILEARIVRSTDYDLVAVPTRDSRTG
jgi:ribosomal protein S12 methylthiotransferase